MRWTLTVLDHKPVAASASCRCPACQFTPQDPHDTWNLTLKVLDPSRGRELPPPHS
jgi:hypothetical protein